MNRNRVVAVLAVIVFPGGLVALFGAVLLRALSRTQRGRRALTAARRSVPAWATHGLRLLPYRAAAMSQQRHAA
ncbi:MAG TPA: hypothetical protein VN874_01580 [Myxococcales bacterium]|nr:hypothetical protein [Myxococcales bacterium]